MKRVVLLITVIIGLGVASPVVPLLRAAWAQDVDLDVVFRCNAGDAAHVKACRATRDLIVTNCTVCHTFVPIVMQQFEPDGWDGLLTRHVSGNRVNNLPPEQVKIVRDYLAATFNPSNPPPDLPKELLDTWTSY